MGSEAVSSVLNTIPELLDDDEFKLLLEGVKNQVENVVAELKLMQPFLKAADRTVQFKDERIRNYLNETRRLAYRFEDVLETYAVQSSRRQRGGIRGFFKRCFCIMGEKIALHKVGSEIENIKTELNNIRTSLETWASNSHVSIREPQNSNQSRTTYAHEVEKYFVGMKDDIRELVSLVTDHEERSHRVISIYGQGGLGKTTLARKIYNNIEVQRCFKAFAWVSITQQFSTKNVIGLILEQLLPDQKREAINKMEETELVMELNKLLTESKCLVVLDDLWEINDWECLKPAFQFVESNSKILITTRDKNVAEVEFSYPLNLFSVDEGWELLRNKAFAKRPVKDFEIDPRWEDIGREIVVNCGKLPLAISTLGGILSQKTFLREWQGVNKDIPFYLRVAVEGIDGWYPYGVIL